MKTYYIAALKKCVDEIIGRLETQGVTDRESYLARFDPEDNDYVAAINDVVVSPVVEMLDAFKCVSFDYLPEGYMLAGKDPAYLDQPMQNMVIRMFGVPKEALEQIFEITNDRAQDIFSCRERLFAYLSALN